ncbi:equilibrative nucleoside transporter 3-like isoform X1 [Daktulosphaira vitifoliae]|uniref:equilibrative nucleoside transporter 3-like isoform X1 n=2 Tax=Daktulosphaira vitifoliae TaxID=58002 RepID=UPI0021AA77DC|nr:equilibrative nucleoside transporter 3-like isoform X1 [Daktulosphaira vitifoliae]
MYKLRTISNSTHFSSIIWPNDPYHSSRLQANFTSFLTIAASIPSTLVLFSNTYLAKKISIQLRMISSLLFMLFLFAFTTVFVNINTDSWQVLFFLMTIGVVVLLNIGSAIMQGAVYGLASFFESSYMTATISGQALGGVFAAIAQILALWWGASSVHSAFVYFLFADIFILLSLVLYTVLVKLDVYKYYVHDMSASSWIRHTSSIQYTAIESDSDTPVDSIFILKKIWKLGLSNWYCYVVTMSVYPAVTVLISSSENIHNSWTDKYFVPVMAYLLFSAMDFVGRLLPHYIKLMDNVVWPSLVISLLRTAFIPLLLFCNAKPRHHSDALIHSDYVYAIIIILFGLTNGVISTITMTSIPKFVEKHEQEVASSIMVTFLGVGIATGSLVSFGMVNLL